ncbi:hypothetical protein [Primorskyibacter sp. 2E233]|uniref:hypothetical protein n=1 Tax=Primorskyibacter sp. 2E233 TaxID=3413431 RepID=UPI003BF4361C
MRFLLLSLILVLCACDSAGPGFRGADKVQVDYEGSRFTLRRRGDVVEAVRTSPEFIPRFEAVARRAAIAAQIETGCHASWVEGDPAMMLIGLSCNGAKAPAKPKRRKMLYCDLYDLSGRDGVYAGAMECGKY